jgi:hypothetical protein
METFSTNTFSNARRLFRCFSRRSPFLRYWNRLLFCIALAGLFPISAFGSFESGIDAFMRGDYLKAAREWRPLAEKGDADAARNLGFLYHQGLGVSQDFATARVWYGKAANKCNATAQNNLGLLLLNGQGGDKDPVRAFRLFEVAAKQGLHADADAMGNLGSMYLTGTGTQPNIIEAYKWYVLYREHTTDVSNRAKLNSTFPNIESQITATQKKEALRRAAEFKPQRCIPQ